MSPAEQTWLKVEFDDEIAANGGRFTSRAIRARHGKEGSARFAKQIAADIRRQLTQLAAPAALTQQRDTALWSNVAYLTLDTNFWGDVSTLGELGVIKRSPDPKP